MTSRPSRFSLLGALCLAGLLVCPPSTVRAETEADVTPTLTDAMKQLGQEIARFVKSEPDSANKVAIGNFQGPPNSGAGAQIAKSLREKLEGECQVVEIGASYSVTGKFSVGKPDGKFVTVIDANINDALGNNVQTLRKKIVTSIEEGLAFFGPSSVDLTQPKADSGVAANNKPVAEQPVKDEKVVAQKLVSSLVKPEVHLDDSRKSLMKLSQDSPYGIEILLKQQDGSYKPLEVQSASGLAKVEIGPTEAYAIRLYNNSAAPVGCRLTIDGINVFALSEDPQYKGREITMALAPAAKFLITGWHHRGNVSHEFLVSNYGDSAAARFGVVDGVGTITATFVEALPKAPDHSGLRSREFATGQGKQVQMVYDTMDVKFGKPLGAVSARYLRAAHPVDLPE